MENNKKKSAKTKVTTESKQSPIEKEFEELNLFSARISVAQQLNDLRNENGITYFKPEWVMKNIIGLTDAEVAESKNLGV